jgi:phospholipase/carboxylesterase
MGGAPARLVLPTRMNWIPMLKIVNGASLKPLSGAAPKQIVLLLHGFGSNGQDMISLAPTWQDDLPDALFLAPHAPQQSSFGAGYQWWGLSDLSPQALAAGAALAAPAVDAFIDRKLAQYGLTDADLAIVGFSQGTMMGLHVGLRRAATVAAIVGYSGMLTGIGTLQPDQIRKPPVLLIHGTDDPVVPVSALHAAESELKRLGVAVSTHLSPGLGHSVDPVGLRLGHEFVAKAFG